jgi:aspartate 4-decarboxylase
LVAGGAVESVMTTVDYTQFDKMSPFEIKDGLIKFAKASSAKSAQALLNAGRGNPNWIATAPREAFFLFGQFALTEARR